MADFEFIDLPISGIVERLIVDTEARMGEPLYPGDERRLFLEAFTPVLVQFFQEVNDACKQRLLKYARNEALDALGERMSVARLAPTSAKTVLRFSLAEPREVNTIIPQGTRATADGEAHFATTSVAVIQAGQTFVDVSAECTEGGEKYNGYGIGSISTMTDLIPYVAGVMNANVSHGGDDGEPMDSGGAGDERYRERVRLAPAKLSTAGPEASYRFHALGASPEVIDVKVMNDHEAGTVEIVLLTDSGDASEDVIQAVEEALNDRKVRPLNDRVIVSSPTRVEYDIELKYYCTSENEYTTVSAIEGVNGAITQFNEWQQTKVGRDINPDKLRALCLVPDYGTGALRVDVIKPQFMELTERDLAKWSGNLVVSHEVTEE